MATPALNLYYNSRGNIETVISDNGNITYGYDRYGRLIDETSWELGYKNTYTYDNYGNIISKNVKKKSGNVYVDEGTINYTYTNGKLTSYNGQQCIYDAIGNPSTYRGNTATWTRGGMLTSYKGCSFAYDGLGRRMSKTVNKTDVEYVYDSADRLIYSTDGIEYFYDETGVAAFKYLGSLYLYKKDIQGNVIALLDSSGNTVVNYQYDAWGNHTISGNTTIGNLNPFRYRGYFYDKETGLYYLQTRYYDPEVGRFISQDKVAYADPQTVNGLNLYAYCGNNPVMYSDPTGTFFIGTVLGAAFGIAGAALAGDIGTIIAIAGGLIAIAATPESGAMFQADVSAVSYVGMAAASIFNSDIRQDMNNIGWNPFNTDASIAAGSTKVSFYGGVPVFRINNDRSGTFGAIWLGTGNGGFKDISDVIRHEWGHVSQFCALGILNYFLCVGIPSFFEFGDFEGTTGSYYNAPWEAWASWIGGVQDKNAKYTASQKWLSFGHLAVAKLFGILSYLFAIH